MPTDSETRIIRNLPRRQGPLPSYWQGLQRPAPTSEYVYRDGAAVPQLPSTGLELPYAHWSWPAAAMANDSEVDYGCVVADAATAYDRWGRQDYL